MNKCSPLILERMGVLPSVRGNTGETPKSQSPQENTEINTQSAARHARKPPSNLLLILGIKNVLEPIENDLVLLNIRADTSMLASAIHGLEQMIRRAIPQLVS